MVVHGQKPTVCGHICTGGFLCYAICTSIPVPVHGRGVLPSMRGRCKERKEGQVKWEVCFFLCGHPGSLHVFYKDGDARAPLRVGSFAGG